MTVHTRPDPVALPTAGAQAHAQAPAKIGPLRLVGRCCDHDHDHGDAPCDAAVGTQRRTDVVAARIAAPRRIVIAPSLLRMGFAGRLGLVAAILAVVWPLTLAVTG